MTIDNNAKVNISVAASIVVTVVGATLWITDKLQAVRDDSQRAAAEMREQSSRAISELQLAISDLKKQVADATNDRYTKTLAAEVALRNAIRNPGTAFTDPRDPNVAIVVEAGKITRSKVE